MITTLFWDVGGVVLTNGWDAATRRGAVEKFGLDWEEFQARHELVGADFDTGGLTLDEYLDCTVFHQERGFDRAAFREFMFSQSSSNDDVLRLVDSLVATGKYLLATLNNESLELNLHRIERFHLRRRFQLFCSSCFLGLKKPDRAMYETALRITQKTPEECVFIDDRSLNLETARKLRLHTVHFKTAEKLRGELKRLGVEIPG